MVAITIPALLSILFGILVIAFPGLLRWIVGVYLILIGLVGIFGF
jgi:hypothetical protein